MQNSQLNGRHRVSPTGYEASPNDAFDGIHGDRYLYPRVNPIRAIWRRLWMIALIVIACVGSAAAFTYYLQEPSYRTSIKVLITQEAPPTYSEQNRDGETYTTQTYTPPGLNTQLQGLQDLTKTMAEAVKTRPITEAVVERLDFSTGPEMVRGRMQAKQIADTQFVEITYVDSAPERAQTTANTIGEVFSEQVSELSPSSNNRITATVWEQAGRPGGPISPNPEQNILIGLAVGLLIGGILAVLLESLKGGWRSPEEVEQISGVPTLGVIPAPSRLSRRGNKEVN